MGSRTKLVEAAAEIFGRNGYRTTSIDEILEIAGVSPSNFYYHFPSKERLAFEVLEGYFAYFREQMRPVFSNPTLPAATKLQRLHAFFAKAMAASGCCGG